MDIKQVWRQFYRNYFFIALIIAVFLAYRIYSTVKFFGVCYDCSIYISQAKYIFSLGASGYFESLRPLVLPIILGFGWLLGIDAVVFGKIVSISFSAATIFLVYEICRQMKKKPAGTFAAILLAITPLYFLYSGKILTGIPSTFFALISFYFFMKRRYALTGLFAALAFMTRFPQGILLVSYSLVFIVQLIVSRKLKMFKQISRDYTKLFVPYFLVVISFLIFNAFKYSDADTLVEAVFWPFVHGATTISKSGLWMYQGDIFYYFVNLFRENYLIIFSVLIVFYYFYEKMYKKANYNFLLFTPLLFILYFTQMPHKELRFALVFLPYIAILSGMGFQKIYDYVIERKRLLVVLFLALIIIVSVINFPDMKLDEYVPPSGKPVCDFINSHDITDTLVITTPYVMPCLDNKLVASFYLVPLFMSELRKNPEAHVVFAPDSFACAENDTRCFELRQEALDYLEENYRMIFSTELDGSTVYVFERKIIFS
ncbi:glycosyltransferase family 39 protein [Candidatus Woesearchaeota archaeon]|nr:glycosyltransferase family 39 protein [Candidatus Woesearchaeota archaeon]